MKRPFRVPGGQVGLWVCVILATGSVLSSLILFLWTPGTPVNWDYTGPLLGFFGVAILAGEVLVGWSLRRYKSEPTQAAQPPASDKPEIPPAPENRQRDPAPALGRRGQVPRRPRLCGLWPLPRSSPPGATRRTGRCGPGVLRRVRQDRFG